MTLQLVAAGCAWASVETGRKIQRCCIRLSACQSGHLEPFFHPEENGPQSKTGVVVGSCVLHVCVRVRVCVRERRERQRGPVAHALAPRSDDVHPRPSLIS